MARIIWDRPGNPTKYVSDRLQISRRDLGRALHKIKARYNLRAADRVVIYDDGAVTDQAFEPLGNIYEEI